MKINRVILFIALDSHKCKLKILPHLDVFLTDLKSSYFIFNKICLSPTHTKMEVRAHGMLTAQ